MSTRLALLFLVGSLALAGGSLVGGADSSGLDFRLKDPRDDVAVAPGELKDKKAVVVVFLGTECPASNAFLPVLVGLHKGYAGKGVAFLGVNANLQDTPDKVAAHAREHDIPF